MKKLQRSVERFKGNTLGLDLHKKMIQHSLLDAAGDEVSNESMPSTATALTKLIDKLTADGTALQVVIEASGCFVWAYDLLASRLGADHVHVAAPSKVKVIAQSGEKTDANDAWWLAYLQYERRLPQAMVAVGDLRELRVVCREYRSVVDERSDLMRRLRSHLAQLNRNPGKNDLKTVSGRVKVAELVRQVKDEHGQRGMAISRLWDRIKVMDEEVEYWSAQRKLLAKKFDEVQLLEEEMSGVGEVTASIVFSELGHPARYRSAKAYAKATGLTPGYRCSGGRHVGQPITRMGSSHVRWALTRAIIACLRCTQGPGVHVKLWVMKLRRRKSTKASVVAAARKLAESIWRLFALGEAFDLARCFGARSSPAASASAVTVRPG